MISSLRNMLPKSPSNNSSKLITNDQNTYNDNNTNNDNNSITSDNTIKTNPNLTIRTLTNDNSQKPILTEVISPTETEKQELLDQELSIYEPYELTFAISYGVNVSNTKQRQYLLPLIVDYMYKLPEGYEVCLSNDEFQDAPFFYDNNSNTSTWNHPLEDVIKIEMKKVIDQYDIILDDSEYDTTTDASNTNTERNNDMEISKQNENSDDSFIALDQSYHLYEITFAISYGINPSNNEHARYLMPAVVDYLYNLPDGFKLYLGKNEYENVPFFFNQIRQESIWTHPNDIKIKEKLEDIRKEYNLELIDDDTLYELSHIQDINDSNISKPSTSNNIPLDPVIEETHDEFDGENDIDKVPLPLSPRPLTRGESLFSPKVNVDLSVALIPPGTLSKRGSSLHSVRSPKIINTSSLSFNIIDDSKLNSARSRSSVSMSSKSLDNKDDIPISNFSHSSSITPAFVPISSDASPINVSNQVLSSKIESLLNSNAVISVNDELVDNNAVSKNEKINNIRSEDSNRKRTVIDSKLDIDKANEVSNKYLAHQDIVISDQKLDDNSIIKPSMSRTTSYKDKRLVVSIDSSDIDKLDSNTSSSIHSSSINDKTISSSIGLSSKYLSDFSTPEARINSSDGLSSKYLSEINTPYREDVESSVNFKDDKVIASIDDTISTSSTVKRKLSIEIINPSDKPISKSVKHIDPIFDNLSSAHSDNSFSSYVSYGSDDSYSSYTGSSRLPTSRSDFYLISSRSKMGDRSFQYNSTSKSGNETPKTLLDNIVNSDDNGSVNSVEVARELLDTVSSNLKDIIYPTNVELTNQPKSTNAVTVVSKVDIFPQQVSPIAKVDKFVPLSTDVTPKHKSSKSSLESPKSLKRSFSPKRASPKSFHSPRTVRSIDKSAVTMILEGSEEDISRANTPAVPIILDIYTNTLSDRINQQIVMSSIIDLISKVELLAGNSMIRLGSNRSIIYHKKISIDKTPPVCKPTDKPVIKRIKPEPKPEIVKPLYNRRASIRQSFSQIPLPRPISPLKEKMKSMNKSSNRLTSPKSPSRSSSPSFSVKSSSSNELVNDNLVNIHKSKSYDSVNTSNTTTNQQKLHHASSSNNINDSKKKAYVNKSILKKPKSDKSLDKQVDKALDKQTNLSRKISMNSLQSNNSFKNKISNSIKKNVRFDKISNRNSNNNSISSSKSSNDSIASVEVQINIKSVDSKSNPSSLLIENKIDTEIFDNQIIYEVLSNIIDKIVTTIDLSNSLIISTNEIPVDTPTTYTPTELINSPYELDIPNEPVMVDSSISSETSSLSQSVELPVKSTHQSKKANKVLLKSKSLPIVKDHKQLSKYRLKYKSNNSIIKKNDTINESISLLSLKDVITHPLTLLQIPQMQSHTKLPNLSKSFVDSTTSNLPNNKTSNTEDKWYNITTTDSLYKAKLIKRDIIKKIQSIQKKTIKNSLKLDFIQYFYSNNNVNDCVRCATTYSSNNDIFFNIETNSKFIYNVYDPTEYNVDDSLVDYTTEKTMNLYRDMIKKTTADSFIDGFNSIDKIKTL